MFEPPYTTVHQVGHFARTAWLSHDVRGMRPERGLLEPLAEQGLPLQSSIDMSDIYEAFGNGLRGHPPLCRK